MEKNFDAVLKQEAFFLEQKKEKEALVLQLKKDVEEQKPKLERVIKQVCIFILTTSTFIVVDRSIVKFKLSRFLIKCCIFIIAML